MVWFSVLIAVQFSVLTPLYLQDSNGLVQCLDSSLVQCFDTTLPAARPATPCGSSPVPCAQIMCVKRDLISVKRDLKRDLCLDSGLVQCLDSGLVQCLVRCGSSPAPCAQIACVRLHRQMSVKRDLISVKRDLICPSSSLCVDRVCQPPLPNKKQNFVLYCIIAQCCIVFFIWRWSLNKKIKKILKNTLGAAWQLPQAVAWPPLKRC